MASTPGTPVFKITSTTHQTLKFLNSAAHLLASDCNVISSHLSRQVGDVAFEASRSTKTWHETAELRRSFEVCASCGTIAVPGVTSHRIRGDDEFIRVSRSDEKEIQKKRKAKPKVSAESLLEAKIIKTKCLICGTSATANIPKYERKLVDSVKGTRNRPFLTPSKAESVTDTAVPIGMMTRSQRRKGSKKEKSLQAMLRKSKENEKQAKSDFGLGLMDLMIGSD